VIPSHVTARVAIELGSTFGWREYVGHAGKMITIDHFGASAPANKLMEEYGFTIENIVETLKQSVS